LRYFSGFCGSNVPKNVCLLQYDCEIQSDGEFRPLWRDRGTQSFTETLGESYFSTAKIKVKSYLPVMRLNYGCIQPASGRPILSRLECDGRNSSPTQPPTSCRDLWQAGNILSGFYFVQPSRTIEVVFCNMTQVPAREETIVSAFVSSEQMARKMISCMGINQPAHTENLTPLTGLIG
jgi:hypothetical protein